MTGHKIKITSHDIDKKTGKLKAKQPRSVSAQVAIASSKRQRVVSPAKARGAR